ncbi:hypothetical protein PBI_EDMUNDO_49 [Arthrobacter phage Edmundo]|nr:hypothetical protein PBI_EDMUNDO_49 [Arthrobacter phage Edmundo]
MNPMTLPPDAPYHNHMTRSIQPKGAGCPGCDAYWRWAELAENSVNPDSTATDAELAARVVEVEGDLVTVEIQPGMAAHMQRHAVGGYSIASTAKPGMVWPL